MADTNPLPFTDEQLKKWARRAILTARGDIDFMGIGEQFEDAWTDLDENTFNAVQRRVHDLALEATISVTWDGEQAVGTGLRDAMADALIAHDYPAHDWPDGPPGEGETDTAMAVVQPILAAQAARIAELEQLAAERGPARSQVAAVCAVHEEVCGCGRDECVCADCDGTVCHECETPYPCRTIRAMNRQTEASR